MAEVDAGQVDTESSVEPAGVDAASETVVAADPVRQAYDEVVARKRDESGKFVSVKDQLEVGAAADAPQAVAVAKGESIAPDATAPAGAPAEPASPRYGDLGKVEETVRPRLAAAGIDFPTYTQRLIAADEFLLKEPQTAIAWLAQQYGVDLRALAGLPAQQQQPAQPAQPAQQQQPDQFSAYHTAIQQQQQQIESLQNQFLSQHLDSQIRAFAAQTDKYPHFGAVRPKMAELFNSGYAGSLEDAYNVAVYSSEELRAKIDADREKQRIDEAAKKAVVARRAAAVNVEPSAAAKPARKATMDETIAELARAAYSH